MLRRGVRTACTIHPGTAVWAQEARILRSRDEFGVVGATTEEVAELSEFDGASESDGVHASTVDLADLSRTLIPASCVLTIPPQKLHRTDLRCKIPGQIPVHPFTTVPVTTIAVQPGHSNGPSPYSARSHRSSLSPTPAAIKEAIAPQIRRAHV